MENLLKISNGVKRSQLILIIVLIIIFGGIIGWAIFQKGKITELKPTPTISPEAKTMEEVLKELTAPQTEKTPEVSEKTIESLTAPKEKEVPEDIIKNLTAPEK